MTPQWREISELEARAIGAVTFPVGSAYKRLARDLARQHLITERQAAFLWSAVWRFRRQISDEALVAHAQPYGKGVLQ